MNFKGKLNCRETLKSIKDAKKGRLFRMYRLAGRIVMIKCRPTDRRFFYQQDELREAAARGAELVASLNLE